ncbi:MAG: hypothetical protein HYT76_01350 [Deltaproteobacteria bacterium]|nr:hypothetical protein [Deltaproteobacteria bacterium]
MSEALRSIPKADSGYAAAERLYHERHPQSGVDAERTFSRIADHFKDPFSLAYQFVISHWGEFLFYGTQYLLTRSVRFRSKKSLLLPAIFADEIGTSLVSANFREYRDSETGQIEKDGNYGERVVCELTEGLPARFLLMGVGKMFEKLMGPLGYLIGSISQGVVMTGGGILGEGLTTSILGSQIQATPWTLESFYFRCVDSQVTMLFGRGSRSLERRLGFDPDQVGNSIVNRSRLTQFLTRDPDLTKIQAAVSEFGDQADFWPLRLFEDIKASFVETGQVGEAFLAARGVPLSSGKELGGIHYSKFFEDPSNPDRCVVLRNPRGAMDTRIVNLFAEIEWMERLKGLPFPIDSPEIIKDSEGRAMLFGNEGDYTHRCGFAVSRKWHEWVVYLNAHGTNGSVEVSSLRNAYRALAYISQVVPEQLNPVAVDLLMAGVRHPDHSIALLAAEGLGCALKEKRFRHLADSIWRDLRIRRIGFGPMQGHRTSTVPRFMKTFLHHFPQEPQTVTIRDLSFSREVMTLDDFLAREGIREKTPQKSGRTDLYADPRTGGFLAIKYAHTVHLGGKPQSGEDLVRELQWLEVTKNLGLQSHLPEPIRDEAGRPLLLTINGREAIAFRTERDYYRQLADPSTSDEDFFKGLRMAIHDAALLARHGVFHTAPLVAFHAQTIHYGGTYQRARDDGRYIPSPDIVFPTMAFGMGKLSDWRGVLKYANLGVTGLRDFEELANLSEIQIPGKMTKDHYVSVSEHAWERPHLSHADFVERANSSPMARALLLFESYFALHLLVGQRMVTQHDGRELWKEDRRLALYADRLLELHAEGYSTLMGISSEKARSVLQQRGDWQRLARNLAFWMSPAYVPFVHPDASPHHFPHGIFHERTEIVTEDGNRFGHYPQSYYDPEIGYYEPKALPEKLPNLGPFSGAFPIAQIEELIWGSLF